MPKDNHLLILVANAKASRYHTIIFSKKPVLNSPRQTAQVAGSIDFVIDVLECSIDTVYHTSAVKSTRQIFS